jgi:hypothetical protein
LNQIEICFSKIERDVIARGVFTSVSDLARRLLRYIKHYNRRANTHQVEVLGPFTRRIQSSDSVVTGD